MEVVLVPKVNLTAEEKDTLRILTGQEDKEGALSKYVEHLLLVAYEKGTKDKGSWYCTWGKDGALKMHLGSLKE